MEGLAEEGLLRRNQLLVSLLITDSSMPPPSIVGNTETRSKALTLMMLYLGDGGVLDQHQFKKERVLIALLVG